ncbi:phosphotransferase family protein [Natronosalvus halobius]|uniref:phosphotransferase family protein n=1 Tax=Natronosalvus halobius TaxID=2953746 RepID=UPI00209E176C|nr:phosphotransferase family protein [Natronosalvus halobius]USZ71713.1 phosphotransferase family protein [Natronosalvus halobius]
MNDSDGDVSGDGDGDFGVNVDLDGHVDPDRLESSLAAELGTRVIELEVVDDGLNLILEVSTDDASGPYMLRKPNKLRDASYMNDLRREYAIMERLHETAVPAPTPVLYGDDESIFGDPYYLMTALEGEPIPLGENLPERFRTPRSRERVAARLVEALADIHAADPEPFADSCHRLTPRARVDRATVRLQETTQVTGHEVPALQSVAEWLRENAPTETRTTLVHGDFRPGNVLFSGTDRAEITGVLDWETAALGDPLTDLGYLLLRWRDANDWRPSLEALETRHGDEHEDALRQLREQNERGLSPFTAKPGSPTRRDLVARYEAATGFAFEHERFYRALAAFSLAVVWEDLHRDRLEAGDPSDWKPYVEYVSLIADGIVGGEFPL